MRRRPLVVVFSSAAIATTSAVSLWRGGSRSCHYGSRRTYRSAISFKLEAHEVNEKNAPSAREVAAMIPSRQELQELLPSAAELEAQYVQPAARAPSAAPATPPPLWPGSDTVEEIMDEERYGSEDGGDVVPPPSPQHILLAWQALMWGTLYAVVGVAAVVCVAMYTCGVRGVSDVLVYLRGRAERERRQLVADGGDANYYVIDLRNPATLVQQVQDIWHALEELAEQEGEEEESISSKKK